MTLVLFILGLALGSFVNALVWRLHEQETVKSKKRRRELSIVNGRSMCMHCRHTLAAKDLLPVISWILLRGRCRYCHKAISWQYPAVELLTAGLFVLSYLAWPYALSGEGLFRFIIWLPSLVILVALCVYDIKWLMLPDRLTYILIGLSLVQAVGLAALFDGGWGAIAGAFWGFLCLGGLFYVIFQVSNGRWIGGGDVKLGFALGPLAGTALTALATLFAASVIGTAVAVVLLLSKKISRKAQVAFGPFLITGFLVVQFLEPVLREWYKRQFLILS